MLGQDVTLRVAPREVLLLGNGQHTQLVQHGLGRAGARPHGICRADETHAADLAQVRLDEHVAGTECCQRGFAAVAHQPAHHLQQDLEGRIHGFRRRERLAHVDDDDEVDAHGARDFHRKIVDDATVDQDLAVVVHGCERARHRHAGANRQFQVAGGEHARAHFADVRGHAAEGDRQIVEAIYLRAAEELLAQEEAEFLAAHQCRRIGEVSVGDTHLEVRDVAEIGLLLAHGCIGPGGGVAKDVHPVDRAHRGFDFLG